jgi:hypothetical protein
MDPAPIFTPESTGETDAAGAGVRLTPEGRIIGADGQSPLSSWLFGAGAIASGGTSAYGHALAEVIATGYRAGRSAALHARG